MKFHRKSHDRQNHYFKEHVLKMCIEKKNWARKSLYNHTVVDVPAVVTAPSDVDFTVVAAETVVEAAASLVAFVVVVVAAPADVVAGLVDPEQNLIVPDGCKIEHLVISQSRTKMDSKIIEVLFKQRTVVLFCEYY